MPGVSNYASNNIDTVDSNYHFADDWEAVPASFPDADQPVDYEAPGGTVASNQITRANPAACSQVRMHQRSTDVEKDAESARLAAQLETPGAGLRTIGGRVPPPPPPPDDAEEDQFSCQPCIPDTGVGDSPALAAAWHCLDLFRSVWWKGFHGARLPTGPVPDAPELPVRWGSQLQDRGKWLSRCHKIEQNAQLEPIDDGTANVRRELAKKLTCAL